MNLCILIPLLVGAICALLGYLLGRLLDGGSSHDDCNEKVAKLEAELEACKQSRMSLEGDLKTTKASLASSLTATSIAASIPFDAAAAKAVFGKKIKENDLTVVEGIGPKIQELFHNHEVKTWKALSECNIEKCQDVLTSGGDRFKMHKPGSWPKQAEMAYQGKWAELLKWQDELDGGK
jgi:predicted flap endonuclease-1-like 5' DNA nuclease